MASTEQALRILEGAWMTRTMARTHASLKSKISPASAKR